MRVERSARGAAAPLSVAREYLNETRFAFDEIVRRATEGAALVEQVACGELHMGVSLESRRESRVTCSSPRV